MLTSFSTKWIRQENQSHSVFGFFFNILEGVATMRSLLQERLDAKLTPMGRSYKKRPFEKNKNYRRIECFARKPMSLKRIAKFTITGLLLIVVFTSLQSCGNDEKSIERIRFTEFVLFPTAPYVDKSYIEIVPEDEVASLEIDFNIEIAAIQEVYSAFIKAYLEEDMAALAKTFDTAVGIEYGTSTANVYGWNNIKTYIEANWEKSDCEGNLNWKLTDFYIRSKNIEVPWTEASAQGPMFYYDPGTIRCYTGTGQFYLTKKSDKWRIHQIDGAKYFTDSKYKAP